MRRSWLMRLAALALGGWAVALLVRTAGTADFLGEIGVVARAIGWLVLLELGRIAAEVGATATQLGRYVQPLGTRLLIRGHLLSYATSTLAPAGRVAGEVIKAAAYSPMLGRPIAAAMAVRIQAASMLAGGAMSGVCAVACHLTDSPPWLVVGLLVHTAIACVAGWMLLWTGHRGGAIKTASRLKLSLETLREGMAGLPRSVLGGFAFLFIGRWVQVVEMAVLLAVLVRTPTLADSLVMEGLFMVGTAAGDLIPGQLGATDAAFTFGASSFSVTAGQGLAVAAAMHVVQLAMAALCSLAAMLPARRGRFDFSPVSHRPDTSEARSPDVASVSVPVDEPWLTRKQA